MEIHQGLTARASARLRKGLARLALAVGLGEETPERRDQAHDFPDLGTPPGTHRGVQRVCGCEA